MSYVLIALTFDAGPDGLAPTARSGAKPYNTTLAVLNHLASQQPPIKAAFFVQTHVPDRMAGPTGNLEPTPETFTPGQLLVRYMMQSEHVVGIMNGSDVDLELHIDQVKASPSTLGSNLQRGVNALRDIAGHVEVAHALDVSFVRSPIGRKNDECDRVYKGIDGSIPPTPGTPSGLQHVLWDTQPTFAPTADYTSGVPIEEQKQALRAGVKKAAEWIRARTKKPKPGQPPPPSPPPRVVVVRLHDVAELTVAHLPELIEAMRQGGILPNAAVPVRFCASYSEVVECLTQLPDKTTDTTLSRLDTKMYAKEPRLARTYGSQRDTLLAHGTITSEGWVPHPYLDSRSNVTVGVGTLVASERDLIKLPFMFKPADGPERRATDEEKAEAWKELQKYRSKKPNGPPSLQLGDARKLTKVYLTEEAVTSLLKKELKSHDADLQNVLTQLGIGSLHSLPLPVQLALSDMAFNLGAPRLKRFRNMFDAIKGGDWKGAAAHCRRQPDTGGLRKRNNATEDLFMAAERLKKGGPPPPLPVPPIPLPRP